MKNFKAILIIPVVLVAMATVKIKSISYRPLPQTPTTRPLPATPTRVSPSVTSQEVINQFVSRYPSQSIIGRDNTVTFEFLNGVLNELRSKGFALSQTQIANIIWYAIQNIVNYYANLPQNSSRATEFRQRIWESIGRGINEVSQTGFAQPAQQQTGLSENERLFFEDGFRRFNMFVDTTRSDIVLKNAKVFFTGWTIEPSWIDKAINHFTVNNRVNLTPKMKDQVISAISDAARRLMYDVAENQSTRLPNEQIQQIAQRTQAEAKRIAEAKLGIMRARL